VDERLHLSDKTLSCPKGKEMCLILIRDMTELLFKFLQEQPINLDDYAGTVFNCSGCTGLIKFSLVQPDESKDDLSGGGGAVAQIDSAVLKMYGKIVECFLLQALPPDQIDIISGHFREIVLEKDAVLISKGEKNLNLYIVFDGELIVESGGVHLATLCEGEICGEMSYLGADVAVSTVKATRKTKVLAMAGDI
jgi:CRP/FNR family cyclic AMP-dependent transcriptional regulator